MMLRHDRGPSFGCLVFSAAVIAFFTLAGVWAVADAVVEWLLGL